MMRCSANRRFFVICPCHGVYEAVSYRPPQVPRWGSVNLCHLCEHYPVMIAQWDSSLPALLVTGFNSQPWQSISIDFLLADHMCCLEHSSGSTKEPSGAPLEKSLQNIMRCLRISLHGLEQKNNPPKLRYSSRDGRGGSLTIVE